MKFHNQSNFEDDIILHSDLSFSYASLCSIEHHVHHMDNVAKVLTNYLLQTKEPPWTSYFVKYADVVNDQRGMSHFNWFLGNSNYHVLRTGCFPYIKYHCTRRPKQDLSTDDKFFKAIKILNLGIPTLMYGLAATFLIRHQETVKTSRGDITIYFLLPEDKGSFY